jgi:hypothetical protein
MRFWIGGLGLLAWMGVSLGQTIDVRPATTPAPVLPDYRPALVGQGPGALINQIDEQKLLKSGVRDAVVMFTCTVRKSGQVAGVSKFRSTPDSEPLQEELRSKLAVVHFIPAVYHNQLVDAVFFGAVSFRNDNGKPRLRIFANQEAEDIRVEADFVAPQIVLGADSSFSGWHYPPMNRAPVEVQGGVTALVEVSENGILDNVHILAEDPPLLGFGVQVYEDLKGARFIPGFRQGLRIASKATLMIFFSSSDELFKVQPVNAPAP